MYVEQRTGNKHNKKFWEELVSTFLQHYTDRIENEINGGSVVGGGTVLVLLKFLILHKE